jgi:hypothetical protein
VFVKERLPEAILSDPRFYEVRVSPTVVVKEVPDTQPKRVALAPTPFNDDDFDVIEPFHAH